MQIHVVQKGQSLDSIAKMYDSSVEAIRTANELKMDTLVTNQALVIPIQGRFVWVQKGESLYTIAKRAQTTPEEVARMNRIQLSTPLQISQRILLPPIKKRPITNNAYVIAGDRAISSQTMQELKKASPELTFVGIFSYQITREGTLRPVSIEGLPGFSKENNVTLVMAITNIEKGAFSNQLAHDVLTNNEIQKRLIDTIVTTAKQIGSKDIHIDFEFLFPRDRDTYRNFLLRAKERFVKEGLLLSTALAPKYSRTQKGNWYEGHDYPTHGEIADFVVLMTYEWGYSRGPARAVSPLPEVRRVLQYAVTEIPKSKILLGQNLYGYDWTLPWRPNSLAKAISPQAAISIARKYNVSIQYSKKEEAPYFRYQDDQNRAHEVWFEDARSILAKIHLAIEYQLKGFSFWRIGFSFPQVWLLLDDFFETNKLS